ncbi:MAG: hypothetical protein ACON35_03795 [Candidatus Marinamargulisbacteria bacterium]
MHYRLVIYGTLVLMGIGWQWWNVRQEKTALLTQLNSTCFVDVSMDDWGHRMSHQLNSIGCRQGWVMVRMDQLKPTPTVVTQ